MAASAYCVKELFLSWQTLPSSLICSHDLCPGNRTELSQLKPQFFHPTKRDLQAVCRDCFDAVYGSSAGAINSTYFLAGQRHGVDVYSQDITTTKFIDLKRLLKSKDKELSEFLASAPLTSEI